MGHPPYQTERHTTTDEEGCFEFPELASRGTFLLVKGEGVLFEMLPLADELEVLDADGEMLRVAEFHGVFLSHGTRIEFRDGRSAVLQVDERAHTLVLFAEDVEVLRMPIALDPHERTVIRL